jgi:hypothetical protein
MRSSVSKGADGTQRGTYPCQNFAESQPHSIVGHLRTTL